MGFRFLVLFFILGVNAFFAAAEVALISARKSRLRSLADRGNAAAQAARSLLAQPARLLSVTQVGVTLASLGLGWAGEDTVYQFVSRVAHPLLTPRVDPIFHAAAFTLAFLIVGFTHVVIGEVVPKNLALDKADRLALLVAPPLLLFRRIAAPFVAIIESSAAALSRAFGLRGGHGGGHSPEELKFIVDLSRAEGYLGKFEEEALRNILDLSGYSTREIMVPRRLIASVSIDAPLDEVLRLLRLEKRTRLPVYEGSPEHIVGFLHSKDLVRVWEERRLANENRRAVRPFRIRALLRKPLVVPETKQVTDLIDEFRSAHTHMAMVVDEFGTIAGLVTLEDVFEQIFGEIGDEYDAKALPLEMEAPEVEVDGSTLIRDLDNLYGVELPSGAGFETLAGFLMFRLGYIPRPGDTVEWASRRFTVLEMDRNRIARVRIEKPPAAKPGA